MEKRKLRYRGESKDIGYNPWLRLVNGRRYQLEIHHMHSGKVRVNVTDGYERARIFYKDKFSFEKEWTK